MSWIRYYSKIIDWTVDTSFEVHRDGSLRYVNPYRSFPGSNAEEDRLSEGVLRNLEDVENFLNRIQLKLIAPLVRNRLLTNLPDVITEMLGQGQFNYRDLFPKTFLKSNAFRHQTIVIPIYKLGSFVENVFGAELLSLNESKEIDIQMVTGLEEHEVRNITERLAKPDQYAERLLLTQSWDH